ncbi:coiled-coil and C2 domain-containing protein 1-like isoform X2 [Folsomia candida]|uniref:Coiled-coil and C2 domain-containing protein 1-like n=1 Tax=Folsomia candida TaxID=158441 RepID=A0A226F0G2_FOLCA|nr:coiled-coil and C2 domain-containing protein 1-like isoform X2 [Folsomia candida]OXA62416.1 Coiled-coil and C2 domain-containing protein 1-like [Folsomia candida]
MSLFGFGKKKVETPASSAKATQRAKRSEEFEQRKAQNKAQLGMFMGLDDDISGGGGGGSGSFDVDDADLENELLNLLGDNKSKSRGTASAPPSKGHGVTNINLDDDEDGAYSGNDDEDDLDDPELHAELGEILGEPEGNTLSHNVDIGEVPSDDDDEPSPPKQTMSSVELVKVLNERLQLYEQAKLASDKVGDLGKSRRFTRGIKTLKELQGKAKAGKVVNEVEIPPAVSIGVASTMNNKPTTTTNEEGICGALSPNTDDHPAPVAEVSTDFLAPSPQPSQRLPEPIKPTPAFVTPVSPPPVPPPRKIVVPPEPPVDYGSKNEMQVITEPPIDYESTTGKTPQVNERGLERIKDYRRVAVVLKRTGDVSGALNYLKLSKELEIALGGDVNVDLLEQFPPVPKTLINPSEIPLTQVPTKLIDQHQSHSEGDPIQTQNEVCSGGGSGEDIFHAPPPPNSVIEALQQRLDKYKSEVDKANAASNSGKARRMGRIVKQYEEAVELFRKGKPVPYDELPTPPGFGPIPVPSAAGGPTPTINRIQVQPQPEDISPEKRIKPGPSSSPSSGLTPPGPSTSSINRGAVGGKPMTKLTLQEKQLQDVQLRQKQYRDAAIEAKKRGDINQAREYLRISKGFDNLIEASKSGLPVDLKTLPLPPEALASLEAEDFELVSDQDCLVPSGGNLEVFAKLEEDLKSQLKMCMRTREHFKAVGDVGSANRFESMALDTKRDLDALRLAAKSGAAAPKYHYENRIFSITECNTDIKEDEIEITVVRGINYKSTSSIDTFIRVELPYPSQEEAQSQKSAVVKDSTDPEYNVTYKMNINRSARNFQRFVQRHGVKVEVWSKGGFLRSSSLFGVATVKLQSLGNKTETHDAFEVLDGRKVVGKVEVKIRLRDPVLTKQITQKKEKWLSIDRA